MHEKYIKRCIELAKLGAGYVSPNPMVGSVIVYNHKIIGEGYHAKYGQPHAEVNAIESVENKSLIKDSTLYITLEPCTHYGKTPPCADRIIDEGIKDVVIGIEDPNSIVAGKGIERLKNAGINVITNILKDECYDLNKRFFTFHQKKRPYIILKWAQSNDGFIAPLTKHKKQISNTESNLLVHKWRSEEQAVMVGIGTVINDNPLLTVRDWNGKNPIRVLYDPELASNQSMNIYNQDSFSLIFNNHKSEVNHNFEFIKLDSIDSTIKKIMTELYNRNIISVLIEGGAGIFNKVISENMWDEARVFISEENMSEGIKSPRLSELKLIEKTSLNNNQLIYYKN